nr:phospholipase D family protein [Massilia forsythiae]
MLAGAVTLGGCASLPPPGPRPVSSAFTDTGATALGSALAPLAAAHPGLSGIYPLSEGRDAFAARILLAQRAERSLDIQYYIWRNDLTGMLMLDALRSAAARGVRVRLLLDDNNTSGLDDILLALARQPNVEVRLFNPFALRGWRSIGYLTDFARLNRRMHNKSFTADNQVTIVGGRNIGDEYFGAAADLLFVDLDVIAAGPAARAVSADFDRYWNSRSAYPIAALVHDAAAPGPSVLAQRVAAVRAQPAAQAYLDAIRTLPFVEQLAQRRLPLEWAAARLVSDAPDKVLGAEQPQARMSAALRELMGEPRRRLDLVSPYFVPGSETTQSLAAMARQGVQVRILTNSLQATDVAAVHAGYAKRRRALLQAGVTVYELRRIGGAPQQRAGSFGSSASSLHAKTFGVDGQRIFVGSFNLDLRSIDLNTEMGLVIESAALADKLDARLTQVTPGRAYEVRLDTDGKLIWLQHTDGGVVRYHEEPGASVLKRAGVRVLSWLPIDWLL